MVFKIKKKLAFSLIELMVTVSVIGILVAIGIPQYNKFKSKSRQIEAKSSLSTFYILESSFISEWNMYTSDLRNVGFKMTGANLRYVVGFDMNNPGSVPCINYSTSGGAPAESATLAYASWACNIGVNLPNPAPYELGSIWSYSGGICKTQPTLVAGTTSCIATSGGQFFRAAAIGDPNSNIESVSPDIWTIDSAKILMNTRPGIK